MLGDKIMAQYGAENEALARVVAIGTDLVTAGIDSAFYSWAKEESIIDANTVVIEWIDDNPLSHNDPQYAPVGDYMTLQSICCERFIKRGNE